ncbi:hypothetical protein J6590_055821 [Homalodisca vitripennis]|nr:hypothetical protein J6590_055821 [Homalodisca vitripennis]
MYYLKNRRGIFPSQRLTMTCAGYSSNNKTHPSVNPSEPVLSRLDSDERPCHSLVHSLSCSLQHNLQSLRSCSSWQDIQEGYKFLEEESGYRRHDNLSSGGDSRQDCILPPHPSHGRHVPYDLDCPKGSQTAECQGVPGTSVHEGWTLFIKCDIGYKAHNNASDIPIVCSGGDWSPPLSYCVDIEQQSQGNCELPSPPTYGSYKTLAVECGLNNTTLTPAVGSLVPLACVLVYNCDSGFTLTQSDYQSLSICYNSAWHPPPHTFSCSVRPDIWDNLAGTQLYKQCTVGRARQQQYLINIPIRRPRLRDWVPELQPIPEFLTVVAKTKTTNMGDAHDAIQDFTESKA